MKLISTFLKIQNQLRMFHWQTPSYAEHKAFGAAYKAFDTLIDDFVEILIGKHGKPGGKITYKLELEGYDENYTGFINSCVSFFENLQNELNETDIDLINLRDEMLGEINKLKYLLQLN